MVVESDLIHDASWLLLLSSKNPSSSDEILWPLPLLFRSGAVFVGQISGFPPRLVAMVVLEAVA